MPKFKVDQNKGLHDQTWWNRLKPEVKLMVIKDWEDTDKWNDLKRIPREMIVEIPKTDLIKLPTQKVNQEIV